RGWIVGAQHAAPLHAIYAPHMTTHSGWQRLTTDVNWLSPDGQYTLRAYSEFMPAPNVGMRPYDAQVDATLFDADDPYGWRVSEIEEQYELRPGLVHLANTILADMRQLVTGSLAHHIVGHREQNLL